ncbi:MAG: hypothetical protein HY241_01885 [Actinobacteria bacterium]|nr:hypothetical protein [Actinomycetota bacterium]
MRGRRPIIAATALAAVVAMITAVSTPWNSPSWWALPGLALGLAIAERYRASFIIGRQAFTFGLGDPLLAAGLLLRPGSWLTVAYGVGAALAIGLRSRQPIKLAFNGANFTGSTGLAVGSCVLLGGGLPGAVVGALVFIVVNNSLAAFPVAMVSGRRYRSVLVDIGFMTLLITVGNASVGLLGGWLLAFQPLGLLGLVVPAGLLWWSFHQQSNRAAEARLFAEIARGHETILGTSVDTSAQVVVTAAARVFGGAEVELLLRHPDGPVLYRGDEHSLSTRSRTEPDAFSAGWVLRALAARGPLVGVEGTRPFVSVVLGDVDRPLAVLIIRRPARAGGFTRADVQLAEVLVTQAESWLSVADLTAQADKARGEVEAYRAAGRVLGDIGADTAPALVVLRESADRLSRLANRFDGAHPVTEIVEELHTVERAVAALLGAVSMAQPFQEEPGDGRGAGPEAEWTTTGRLEPADRR